MAVNRRVVGTVLLACIGWRVVRSALSNPALDQCDLMLRQWGFALRHFRLALHWNDLLDQKALRWFVRNNRRFASFACRQEFLELGHHIAALGLGRLMTPVAVRLKD